MTLPHHTSLFDTIEAHVAALPDDAGASAPGPAAPRTPPLHRCAARALVHGPARDGALAQAIWSDVLGEATTAPAPGDTATLLVVWYALPRLRRSVWRIARRLPAERADLEAETVQGLLEGLPTVDPLRAGAAERVMRRAASRAWLFARGTRHERAFPDTSPVWHTLAVSYEQAAAPDGWAVHITPPDRADGLATTLRFTRFRQRVEGERIGALADGMGLRHLVHRARRPGPGRPIGTLTLQPHGSL
ncbi:hypothetical protein OYE22_17365 [Streptomyces sp. 71268]|uniref:hypothetical protein n=1 Tax=Streptomyces sp. 71268 TaxID=3002640 RepID=UPI0023F87217|nr:hypothetical protein [Streptomyces sp. 71268]WEV26771.1 hypothetical protein OYE22_17365 [Streptomyces sp. 71268]